MSEEWRHCGSGRRRDRQQCDAWVGMEIRGETRVLLIIDCITRCQLAGRWGNSSQLWDCANTFGAASCHSEAEKPNSQHSWQMCTCRHSALRWRPTLWWLRADADAPFASLSGVVPGAWWSQIQSLRHVGTPRDAALLGPPPNGLNDSLLGASCQQTEPSNTG